MLGFLKKLFGFAPAETAVEAPYKVETTPAAPQPAQCGCGRSPTGNCVGLHKLTPEEWATHADNPAKAPIVEAKAVAKKAPAKTKAPVKPKAPAKPRAPKKSVAK